MFELGIGRIVHARRYSSYAHPSGGPCRAAIVTGFNSERRIVDVVAFQSTFGAKPAMQLQVVEHEDDRGEVEGWYWHAHTEEEFCS